MSIGHNKGPRMEEAPEDNGEALRDVVERIERLEEEKAALLEDLREVYKEAKGRGLDVKVLRKVVARRRRDPEEVRLEDEMIETYIQAILG